MQIKKPLKQYATAYPQDPSIRQYYNGGSGTCDNGNSGSCETCNTCNSCSNQTANVCGDGLW